MAEKQTVSGKVVPLSHTNTQGQCMICFMANFGEQQRVETFMWPYAIPEGTPVKVTVEVGGKARKVKGA